MGGKNMTLVMNALKDADVRVPVKNKRGEVVIRELGPYELLLLNVIAYCQHDGDGGRPDDQCICYVSPSQLAKISRIKRSSLFTTRSILEKCGLIKVVGEGKFLSVKDDSSVRTFTNVCQLNKPKLMSLASRPKAVQQVDGGVQQADDGVQQADDGVQQADTKNTLKNTTNITIKKKPGDDCGIADEKGRVEAIARYIRVRHDLPEALQIVADYLRQATHGKDPVAMRQIIDEYPHPTKSHLEPENFHKWIGALVNRFKSLPEARELPPDEMRQRLEQFVVLEPVKTPSKPDYQKIWDALERDYRTSEFSAAQRDELRELRDIMLRNELVERRRDFVNVIHQDSHWVGEDRYEFNELCARFSPHERFDNLKTLLMQRIARGRK